VSQSIRSLLTPDQAVSIKIELVRLGLPGIIGASTVLIIAYAAVTFVHIGAAAIREFIGRPIGLWRLGDKMFWVGTDIVMVCLWASTLSLAINDLIATPLECVSTSPWWTPGLGRSYAQLVENLAASANASANALLTAPSNLATNSTSAYTPVSRIASTLGIQLPEQVVRSTLARQICHRHEASIALSLFNTIMYAGTLVLSLYRIFETIARSASAAQSRFADA
jgi:hypothetical protein